MNKKELNKCYDWWRGLTEQKQFDILCDFFIDEITEDTDIDKFFGDMPDKYQLEIYEGEKK